MSWGMYYIGESSAVLKKVMETRAYPEYSAQTAQLNAVKRVIGEVVEGMKQVLDTATMAAGGTPSLLYLDLKANGHMDASGNCNLSLELKRIYLEI